MKKVTNNLVIELHVPDFQKVRNFYSMFGFYELSMNTVFICDLRN